MAKAIFDHSDAIAVNRPAERVFDQLSDIEGLFASMQRKTPIEVARLRGEGAAAVGDRWRVAGTLRIGRREGVVAVTRLDRPTAIAFSTDGGGYLTETEMTIASAGDDACRLAVRNRISANSVKARLAAPFIRLYRRRIEKGFRKLLKRAKKRLEG